jgi:GDP-L-fucose synthase
MLMLHTEKIYVAGHRGLAGTAIWRHLEENGYANLVGFSSEEVDLTDRGATLEMMKAVLPDIVVDAAALVGGIQANKQAPVDFLHENLRIQINLMDAAHINGVERLLFLGSSCVYPKFAPQPIQESSLLGGLLEETNIGYAVAKIAGVIGVQSFRKQHNRRWISAMPTNLYGPYDNYDLESSHVLAAFIRRFHEAKIRGLDHVKIWGTGSPLREFLHTEDLASAVLFLLENYDDPEIINVGSGEEISINDLALLISDIVGFEGVIEHDTSKPDGTPRKMLDSSKLINLGWKPRRDLREGVADAYDWFLQH